MNKRTCRLSKTEMKQIDKVWGILSDYTSLLKEKQGWKKISENELYNDAMNAVVGLCDFIGEYEARYGK